MRHSLLVREYGVNLWAVGVGESPKKRSSVVLVFGKAWHREAGTARIALLILLWVTMIVW
jgi:hypothetical protein